MCTIVLYKPHHCSTFVKLSWRRNIHKKCVTFCTARHLMNRVGLLENKLIYQSQHKIFYYAVTFTWATCLDSFLSHLQALFKIQILLPTLKMHHGIPNAYNFCMKTLYRCKFHQYYYMDTVHSLYIFLKNINNGRYLYPYF
jgi:hypothetical protein